jgi:type II secretory pathway pseudopilin PulG
MPEESTAPVAGWYPTPDGGTRFWDGEKWLALPAPDDQSPQSRIGDSKDSSQDGVSGMAPESANAKAVTKRKGTRKNLIIALLIGGLIAVGSVAAVTISTRAAEETRLAAAAAAEEQLAADEAKKAAAAEAAQNRKDTAERALRATTVTEIEDSVKQMAQTHADDGVIDGPILDSTCSPVSGGSTDDLTETTTVFECFVGTEDIGNGQMRGYTYNATMNWTSGQYTYALGSA